MPPLPLRRRRRSRPPPLQPALPASAVALCIAHTHAMRQIRTRVQAPRPASCTASSPGRWTSLARRAASASCAATSLKWAPSSGACFFLLHACMCVCVSRQASAQLDAPAVQLAALAGGVEAGAPVGCEMPAMLVGCWATFGHASLLMVWPRWMLLPAHLPACLCLPARRYLLVYPHGCDVANHLSLFLCVADYDKLLPGWGHFAQVGAAPVLRPCCACAAPCLAVPPQQLGACAGGDLAPPASGPTPPACPARLPACLPARSSP